MEKKNTMLLTVIAVATLLVAVVGATFAYFSLTVTSADGTATANVSAGNIGAVTFTGGEKTLTLSVTAEDMAKPGSDRYYFATVNTELAQASGGHWEEGPNGVAPQKGIHTIETVTLAGGETTDTYTCTGSTLKVTVTGTEGEGKNMLTALTSEGNKDKKWVVLRLYGSLLGEDKTDVGDAEEIVLNALTVSGNQPVEINNIEIPEIKLSAGGTKTMNLKAELYLVNSQTDDQGDLAGKGLTVTITFTPSKTEGCTVAKTQS